ncbi:MAG: DNA primase [Hydrococcus sp. RU_2_2]|nr:DNA primase [Hydrococcus sp. RU_2_2]NJP20017.1 DNA primase [Hydrococcus sp. CRU_1_1]
MEVPRLHPDTIEDVKQRVDIYDVVSEHVVLRKRGKDYVGLCPFHDEKTPSFTVSSSKQMYYCFGCNAGGGAVKFLMELRKQSFSDVVLDLAGRYQIPVKTLEPEQRQELQRQLSVREQLYEILALTTSFYQHALRQSQGEIALKYLKSDRNLSEETIQQFQLGYAPAGWETLYRYLVEQKRYPLNLVEEAGLIKPRKTGNGYYDVFRDRIIIPICDSQGRVIAFGSRTVQTRNFASPQEPKYLNSPETPLFDKSKTLFALDKAKHSISKEDRAIVVEGYFDAIALHAAGITNAVASLGTAFSQQHIRLLMRYTESKQVIFNFDADNAGTSATHRAINEIETLVNTGLVQVRILNLPDGKDADEFLNSSPEAVNKYRQLIQSAPLWFDWQIQQLLKGRSLKQADQFEQVAQNMVKLLNKLEDSNQRTYYIRYCAEILSLGDVRLIPMHVNSLFSQVRKTKRRFVSIAEPTVQSTSLAGSEKSLLETAETDLLGVYLHCSRFRDEIIEALEEKELLFTLPHHRFLWRQIVELQEIGNEPYRLYSQLQDRLAQFPEQMNQLSHLFHLSETKHWEDSTRAPIVIRTAIASLEQVVREKYRRYCQQQIQQLSPNTDVEQMQYYYQEIQNTIVQIRELEKLRHNSQV